MGDTLLEERRFSVPSPNLMYRIEALCVTCGADLIVVVGGGSRYHLGALGLTLSMPSIKDAAKLTNSTYQVPIPGHKEEALAREGSLFLSKALKRNVLVTVGVHEDNIAKTDIPRYVEVFNELLEAIRQAYAEENDNDRQAYQRGE